jgi:branched-subunit amino acid transport protein
MNKVYIYIIGMAIVTYLIRVLPLTLIRKKIKNVTIRSFLYYVPYVTLAVMTFPSILTATQSPISAVVAMLVAMALAFCGRGLLFVAVVSCAVVFVIELFVGPTAIIALALL